MRQPRIHLIGPAGSCRPFIAALGVNGAAGLIRLVSEFIHESSDRRYEVTGDGTLIEAGEDENHGGRRDDEARAADITRALADDDVAAILALRGGAWLTRVIPRIQFDVLESRTNPVAVLGFSELSTVVNIVGSSRSGVGVYDMSPAFLTFGLKRYFHTQVNVPDPPFRICGTPELEEGESDDDECGGETPRPVRTAEEFVRRELRPQFREFLADVCRMIEGRGTSRGIEARLVRGRLAGRTEARFVGGNVCVMTTLLGTRWEHGIAPDGKWLVLEEINEKPERIDRFIARLTLAGYFERCAGVLLGDFHNLANNHTQATVELLDHHLPRDREVPVLVTRQVGHIWPVSPVLLHRPGSIERTASDAYSIAWPAESFRTVES